MTFPLQGEALAPHFLARVPPARAAELAALSGLEQRLRALLDAARAAWPALDLPAATFLGHLAERLPISGNVDAALAAIQAAELYLACACAAGEPRAIEDLEREVLEAAVSMTFVARSWEGFSREELHQQLRQHLLVPGASSGPKILDYSGRGPLLRWARAVTERLAIKLYHEQRRHPVVQADEQDRGPLGALELVDPELRLLKADSREALREALRASLKALPAERRRLLRLHYVDGVSLEYLSTIFHAHRSSISRWLADAREALLVETRRYLAQQFHLSGSAVDSLIDFARSDLSVSFVALDEP